MIFQIFNIRLKFLFLGIISPQFVESFETALAFGLPRVMVRNNIKSFVSLTNDNGPTEIDKLGFANGKKKSNKSNQSDNFSLRQKKSLSLRSQSAPMTIVKSQTEYETTETKSIISKSKFRPHTQLNQK